MPRPRAELRPGAQLDDADIDAMIELRAGMIRFKPSCDRERDRAKFRAFVAGADWVLRLLDEHGQLIGMTSARIEDGQHLGRRYRIVLLEYGFVLPRYRGHPLWTFSFLRLWLCALAWDPRVSNFVGGVGYLHSALRLLDVTGGAMQMEGDPEQAPLHRHVLARLRRHFPGESGSIIELATCVGPPSPAWVERHAHRPDYQRYVARVPNWYEGYALPFVTAPNRYRLDHLLRSLARSLRRRIG